MRKILIPPAIFVAALTFIIMNSDALMDTSARGGRVFAVREIYVESARPSSALSKSLAHYTMGIIYDNEEKFTDAIREYREALSLEPNISYVHTRLAVDYILTNNYKTAFDELKAAKVLESLPASNGSTTEKLALLKTSDTLLAISSGI